MRLASRGQQVTRSRTPPLVFFGLAVLAAANALFLIMAAQQTMFEDQVSAEEPGWTPRLPSLEGTRAQSTATVSHQEILAHPIFSRSRAPFVPPAPTAPAPKPAPAAIFVDPGLVLGGVMVNGAVKKAYLFQKTDHNGSWVGEGEDFVGWKVQSITTEAAKLQKESHVIEVLLYPEK
jgi:hypothetical protein